MNSDQEKQRLYYLANKEKINEKKRLRERNRYNNDPEYRQRKIKQALDRFYRLKQTNNNNIVI